MQALIPNSQQHHATTNASAMPHCKQRGAARSSTTQAFCSTAQAPRHGAGRGLTMTVADIARQNSLMSFQLFRVFSFHRLQQKL
jgi:hypothetical protein